MTYPMQVLLHIVVVALYKIDFCASYVSSTKASEQLCTVTPMFYFSGTKAIRYSITGVLSSPFNQRCA